MATPRVCAEGPRRNHQSARLVCSARASIRPTSSDTAQARAESRSKEMGGGAPTCSFVPDKGMFLLKNPKGKSLNTYGSHLPQERQSSESVAAHPKCGVGEASERGNDHHAEPPSVVGNKSTVSDETSGNNTCAEKTSAKSSAEAVNKVDRGESKSKPKAPPQQTQLYLFIEEVLFLHERGLVEVYKDDEEKDRLESSTCLPCSPSLVFPFQYI